MAQQNSYGFYLEPTDSVSTPGGAEPFSLRWSPDEAFLAAGLSDGTVSIYQANGISPLTKLDCRLTPDPMPITCMRWRPAAANVNTKNVLLTVTAEGCATHWHVTSSKSLHNTTIENDQCLCADFSPDGSLYGIGCKTGSISIFDEKTKNVVSTLEASNGRFSGHGNRVHSIKFLSENEIATGGWDSNLLIWDIRSAKVIQEFYGPQFAADTLDVKGDIIMAGSYTTREQIQMFSRSENKKIKEITLSGSPPCLIYTSQFSKADDGRIFLAGGKGGDEVHFFETRNFTKFAKLKDFTRAIYSCDFSEVSNKLAIGCGDGTIQVMKYVRDHSNSQRSSTKASEQGLNSDAPSIMASDSDASLCYQYDSNIATMRNDEETKENIPT